MKKQQFKFDVKIQIRIDVFIEDDKNSRNRQKNVIKYVNKVTALF